MNRFATLLLASLLTPSAMAADTYSIDSRHTFPAFYISHMGFSMQSGRFNKTRGSVTLDPEAKTGSTNVVIETASIDMGLDEWDKHMRAPGFFDVEKFPEMTFVSDAFTFENGKPVAADGTLTLLGVSKPVRVNVSNFNCGLNILVRKTVCGGNLVANFKRSDFGMTKYLPMVGDDVTVSIPIEAMKN